MIVIEHLSVTEKYVRTTVVYIPDSVPYVLLVEA